MSRLNIEDDSSDSKTKARNFGIEKSQISAKKLYMSKARYIPAVHFDAEKNKVPSGRVDWAAKYL
uniref:Uncharacterized protein n=1 Tax=Romanomermis culicivorax TaxID=13658 RepID=A0A915L2X0_ROMCU